MDSCHIFNILFGTKKATTELSKCFSSTSGRAGERSRNRSRKEANEERSCNSRAPSSPLRQLQMKIVDFATGSTRKWTQEHKRGSSCDARCGTYRASLVESLDDPVEEDLNLKNDQQEALIVDSENRSALVVEPLGREDTNEHKLPERTKSDVCQQQKNVRRQVVLYDTSEDKGDKVVASAEVYNVVSEIGEARARLRKVSSVSCGSEQVDLIEETGKGKQEKNRLEEIKLAPGEKINTLAERRSAYLRNLAQSYEPLINGNGVATQTKRRHNSLIDDSQFSCEKPTTIVKPMPPKTPPKSNKAKCLTIQMCLNKPVKIQALFQDERFLTKFFDKLQPLDRCVAAQVCRKWRNILYSNQNYWRNLINVIDCTQLRRELLVECIMNTLQSAKLKQQRTIELSRPKSDRLNWSVSKEQLSEFNSSPTSKHPDGEPLGCALDQNNNTATNQQPADRKKSSPDSYLDIDQEDVWRIQELCNRYTLQRSNQWAPRPQQQQVANQDSNNLEHNQHCVTSKSSSIPSQISSTLSSVSLSSLLSPLSESCRIESIKEKLFVSIDDRGFDAICLFGATDEDIDDLVCKTPSSAHKRITAGRLINCCISNRGLELFVVTFDKIQELELSGCNEISNSFELKPLKQLKRLIITDCINIADGIAQRLVQTVNNLEELTIQAYHLTDAFLDYFSLNADTSQLKRLELPNCKELTNQSLFTVAKHLPFLEALSISGSTKITDDGIEVLAEQSRRLTSLDLSWCSRITDASLECLACDLGELLTELILDRNDHVTDIGLGYLATMSKLTLLHIRWCPRITDAGLESIFCLKSLRYLSLAGLLQITARSLLGLVDTNLLEVELTNCPAVNSDLSMFLSSKMPNCNIIF